MTEDLHTGQDDRPLLVRTVHGTVEGILRTSALLRTLDDLNVVTKHFLTLRRPRIVGGTWQPGDGPLAIAKSTIQFVSELGPPPRRPRPPEAARFFRAPLRLWVGALSIEGFLHVPRAGDVMSRLNQSSHPFLALTSVSVLGPDVQLALPFLAVSRRQVHGAQAIVDAGAGDTQERLDTVGVAIDRPAID